MMSKTLLTLLAATTLHVLSVSAAQVQCPAGTPNVQANSNGVLYAIIPYLLGNGEAPNKAISSVNGGTSGLDCSVKCDAVPGCQFATFDTVPDNQPPIGPVCTFYPQTYSYAFTIDPLLLGVQFPENKFEGAVSCACLAANPDAYPPIDARASFFESQYLAGLTSTTTAGLTTLTTAAPPTTAPPATGTSSSSAGTGGATVGGSGGKTSTTTSVGATATGAYKGPQSNEASSLMGLAEVLFGFVSTMLTFML